MGYGGGVSNRVSANPDDTGAFGGAAVVDGRLGIRLSDNIAASLYFHFTLRDGGTIGDTYEALFTNLDELTVPLLFVGWAAGTNILYGGPSVSWYSRRKTPALFLDGGGGGVILIDPSEPCATTGLGYSAGVGVQITKNIGLVVRAVASPESMHGNIGPGDRDYYSLALTLEQTIRPQKKKK